MCRYPVLTSVRTGCRAGWPCCMSELRGKRASWWSVRLSGLRLLRFASYGVIFVLQTPNGLLLTPSPLLSSIHFWSSLSPVAPLSPARLQGPNTLFQVGLANAQVSSLKVHMWKRHQGNISHRSGALKTVKENTGINRHFEREVFLLVPPLNTLYQKHTCIVWRKQKSMLDPSKSSQSFRKRVQTSQRSARRVAEHGLREKQDQFGVSQTVRWV